MSDSASSGPVILAGIEQQDAAPVVLTPGAQLAAQREARGWTVEEVAMQLNLAPRQIQALEAENYAALPGIASVRGFIRGYAKVLKIDPAPLLAMIASETAKLGEPMLQRKALSEPFSENRLPTMGRQSAPSRSIVVAGAFVLLLAAVLISQQMGLFPELRESISSIIKNVSPASSQVQNAPAAGAPLEPVSTSAQGDSGMSSEPAAPVGQIADPAPAPAQAIAPATMSSVPSATNTLVLTLRADSWVEVARANRTTLIARVLKAGTTETIEISEPVSLTIGNVAGVDASWRGAPLDINAGAKTNVIRLNLK